MKVILNKSTKIKGKGFVLAGIEIDVTDAQKKALDKGGFLGEIKKDNSPSNDKEIKELVAKVITLEKQVKDGGDNTELIAEIATLKADAEKSVEATKVLEDAAVEKDAEIATLKADLAKATKK